MRNGRSSFSTIGVEDPVLVNANPHLDPNNNIVGAVGVGQDVTQMRSEKKTAATLANDFLELAENADAPIIGLGSSMEVMEWSPKVAIMLGTSKEEALGKDFVQTFVKPRQQQDVKLFLQSALFATGSHTSNYEVQLVSTSGNEYTVLLTASLRLGPDNNIVGFRVLVARVLSFL